MTARSVVQRLRKIKKWKPLHLAFGQGKTKRNLGGGWLDVIGARTLQEVAYCEFGFADLCIGYLAFTDGTFEVGGGEACRPYRRFYAGKDKEEALFYFEEEVRYRADRRIKPRR